MGCLPSEACAIGGGVRSTDNVYRSPHPHRSGLKRILQHHQDNH